MRTYETIFIVHPEVSGDAYAAAVEKFRDVLQQQGANIHHVEEWGNRKLAYLVKKQARGSYVLMAYEASPEAIAEFERRLRLDEQIIKFQSIFLEKGFQAPAPEKAAVEPSSSETVEEEGEETEESVEA